MNNQKSVATSYGFSELYCFNLFKCISIVLMFFVMGSASVSAHHSFATFDRNREVTIEGTVVKYQWANPHVWLTVSVVDDAGEETIWGIEGQSPNILARTGKGGWGRKAIKAGDKVIIRLNPNKDGTPGGVLVTVTFEDGHVLERG
jgi:hypothetical protein